MRAMGTVLLTGAAAIIVWKILAAVMVGMLGLALKVGLVLLVVFFLLKIFNGNKKKGPDWLLNKKKRQFYMGFLQCLSQNLTMKIFQNMISVV